MYTRQRHTFLSWSGHLGGEDYTHWKYFRHAITSAKKKKKDQKKTPKTMVLNMRTSSNSLPPVIAFPSVQSVHLSACLQVTLLVHMCPSLQRFSLCFIFSLSLNKRAVIVRSICPFWQLMPWSSLHLLYSRAGQCSAVFSSQYPYF